MTTPITTAEIARLRELTNRTIGGVGTDAIDAPLRICSILTRDKAAVLEAILDQLDAQAAEIEKWKQLSLVAEEVTDARLADLLECDAEAKGHAFSDAAAVFMRKATRLQRECDVIRASRDDLEDERHRLAVKCEQAEARMRELEAEVERLREELSLYANGAQCRMEERDSARNERESYKRRLIEAQDSLAVHHRRADQAEARVRELEAMGNAAIMGQHSLHSDMIGRWGDLRDAVLHGLDGLNNDQTNEVLGCIDDHFPSDINPAAAEDSSATENRADKAEARVEKLEALLLAVKCGEFSGITCDNVSGRCWFDARDAALAKQRSAT